MSDDPYVASRVRAMRSRLLDGSRYAALLATADLPGFIRLLQDTPYRAVFHGDESGMDASAIEDGLRRDLRATIGVLRSACNERWRALLDVLVGRWEVANLKTVLWGRGRGASVEDVLAGVYPIGWSDEVALAELARQPTLDRVADTLVAWRHPLSRPLKMALLGRARLGLADARVDVLAVEAALDRAFLVCAHDALDPERESNRSLVTYLGYVIDVGNLVTAMNRR
ncbi:MAG: V-type ATPase subunit, partial [Nitrospiria bacterium]